MAHQKRKEFINDGDETLQRDDVRSVHDVQKHHSLDQKMSSFNILVIERIGPMYEYDDDASVPWNSIRAFIKNDAVEEGITSIGSYSFSRFVPERASTLSDSTPTSRMSWSLTVSLTVTRCS